MLSNVYIYGVSFGEETQSIRNMNTVEVLIFNPNDPYISVHNKRGSHTATADSDKMWIADLRLR